MILCKSYLNLVRLLFKCMAELYATNHNKENMQVAIYLVWSWSFLSFQLRQSPKASTRPCRRWITFYNATPLPRIQCYNLWKMFRRSRFSCSTNSELCSWNPQCHVSSGEAFSSPLYPIVKKEGPWGQLFPTSRCFVEKPPRAYFLDRYNLNPFKSTVNFYPLYISS